MSAIKRVDKINVRVAVRVRPMSEAEKADGSKFIVKLDEKKQTVACKTKAFSSFDKVYGPATTQEQVYNEMVSSQVDRVLAGYNCTLFAYGQTGTGKTYTMEGGSGEHYWYRDDPTTGIVPRAVEHIFEELEKSNTEEYSVRVSYLELYNEELFDLLAPTSEERDRERLRIFDDPTRKGVVVISGAEEIPVRDRAEVYRLLKTGAMKRTTAATLMNMNSSRSHSIFIVSVVIRENTANGEELVKQGKLNLVDLAGSEHIGRSGAEGKRAKEAGNINQSLLTLGRVITALTTSAPHVPYRESKLTRLLQDSLGGATITSIIATLSPASTNYEETLSTLEYAARAKSIKNHPECNQKLSRKALFKEYNEEIERLRRDLRTAREKNGIFLSQESYEGMEKEIAEKTEKLEELEGQLDVAIGKLQKFIEDQEIMDEQYRELYHRNKRLESKLKQRVDELDDAKKNLAVTSDRLAATKSAFEEIHGVARKLSKELRGTREVVFDQQLDIEEWWTKTEDLTQLVSQNRELVEAIRSKVAPEVTDCCAVLSDYITASNHHRDAVNRIVEGNVKKNTTLFNDHKHQVKKGRETLQQKISESDQLCQSFMSRIMELSSESATSLSERLLTQMGELNATSEKLLETFAKIEKQAADLSNVLKELKRDSEFMVVQRRKLIDEDRMERAETRNALQKQEEKICEISELAQAILRECSLHKLKNEEILKFMELHDQSVLEQHAAQTGTWESTLQEYDAMAAESLMSINKTSGSASDVTKKNMCSISCALKEACSNCNRINDQLKQQAEDYMLRVKSSNASTHDDMMVIQDSTEQICDEIRCINDEMEAERSSKQIEEVKREECMVQDLRDRLGVINKDVADMVDVHWIHPQRSGTTPARSHRKISEDESIPSVPKKDVILQSSGYINVTPKRSSRTRESLLEVQNIILSPDTLAANRKARLEDISEETNTVENRTYDKSRSDIENSVQ